MLGRILESLRWEDSTLRKIRLSNIDFGKVKYQSQPLDIERVQPVETLKFR